jgi:hypothetical protein
VLDTWGRADIANYIISQGGRFDIFVAAMLGRLDIVKNALTAFPNLAQSKGPHGFRSLCMPKKDGENASEVVKYLESFEVRRSLTAIIGGSRAHRTF